MGGKCIPGTTLLMKPARDKKGNLVGKDAINPKFGTPKCEFIAQLLRVDESELGYEPTWVGAHPSLGEKIAEQLVERNLLGPNFPRVKSFQREVSGIGGADMRADFLIQHEAESLLPRVLDLYPTSALTRRKRSNGNRSVGIQAGGVVRNRAAGSNGKLALPNRPRD